MLQRMLIDKMENRVLLSIVAFVGIMIMIGWVAINENPRMASFTRQFEARAIERGAHLFDANCSTCHGTDGRGIAGRAPALNNPHLFGHDFFANIKRQRTTLEVERLQLENERTELAVELAGGVSDRRQEDIRTRLSEIDARLGDEGIALELTALTDEENAILDQIAAAVDNGYDYERVRLEQANWGGTVDQYLYTTLVHGRGQNAELWGGNVMVAWSELAGGNLRDDQLRDIVGYIMNWDRGEDWSVEDLLSVNQFAIMPGAGGGSEVSGEPAGTDADAIIAAIETDGIVGDADRGEQLYNNRTASQLASRLGCSGCHAGGVNGPTVDGTWSRVENERLTLPEFAGYTVEKYLIESIVDPGAYIAPGYQDGIMLNTFGERMSVQDIADVLAYLETTAE